MPNDKSRSKDNPTLREQAEERLAKKPERERSYGDTLKLIHEFEVHQIELEMQNEELRVAQTIIEESRSKYVDLYDFTPVGFFTLDEKGLILELNLTAAQLLGENRAILKGKPFSLFITSDNQDEFYFHKRKVLESSERQACDLVLKKKDGTLFHGHLDSMAVKADDHQLIVRSVLIDISQRKLAEAALKESEGRLALALRETHERLELAMVRRKEELSNAYEKLKKETLERENAEDRLRQAQKMEAVGVLAGGIAHDFNNILASILGFTEMAVEDVADRPLVQKSLQNVLKSTMRAKELVKQLLAFSRKTEHVRGALQLSPIIKETIQLLKPLIPASIKLTFETKTNADVVLASPTEVQQIVMNLITNASLAMQGKEGAIEISLSDIGLEPCSLLIGADVAQAGYVQLIVKDTGIGMTPEVVNHIFEPFYTTRDVGKGTGMGLSVVYGIVRSLNGAITVESEPGIGSTFRILLPKAWVEVEEERVQTVHSLKGNEKILFIDDEETLVELNKAILERLGYTVTATTDSIKALEIFSSDPSRFDLVITDQGMPGMTGVHLSKEILKVRKDIPIVLCTGYSDNVSVDEAKEMGICEFLLKPLTKQEMVQTIRRVLDKKQDSH